MLKKTISALFAAFLMIIGASAAGTIFPAQRTDIDGVTRYGYLDEEGRTMLSFSYTQAGEFDACLLYTSLAYLCRGQTCGCLSGAKDQILIV